MGLIRRLGFLKMLGVPEKMIQDERGRLGPEFFTDDERQKWDEWLDGTRPLDHGPCAGRCVLDLLDLSCTCQPVRLETRSQTESRRLLHGLCSVVSVRCASCACLCLASATTDQLNRAFACTYVLVPLEGPLSPFPEPLIE